MLASKRRDQERELLVSNESGQKEQLLAGKEAGEEVEAADEQGGKKKSPGGEKVARNRRMIGRTREEAREASSVAETEAEVEDDEYLDALGELNIDRSHNHVAKPALGENHIVTFTDEPAVAMPWNTREQNQEALQDLEAGLLPAQTQDLFDMTTRLINDNGGLMSNMLGQNPLWDNLGLDLNWTRQPERLDDGSWNPTISADHADAFVDMNAPMPTGQQAGGPGPAPNASSNSRQPNESNLSEPDTSIERLDTEEAAVAGELEQDGWGEDPGYFEEAFNAIMAARGYEGGYNLNDPVVIDDDEEDDYTSW